MRKRAGLNQKELVRKMNSYPISISTLSRIERGKYNYSIDMLFNIAAVLNCDISDFFQVEEKQSLKITIEGDPKGLIEKIVKEGILKIRK